MTRKHLFGLITVLLVMSLALAGCGGDDDEDATATSPSAGGPPTATPTAGEDGGQGEPTEEDGDSNGGGDMAAAGEEIYNAQCAACHTTDGSTGVGPTWQGLWMSEVTLADGSTVTADEEYITESIREPNAKVHEGFNEGIMPAFDLSDEEISQVIAFMQTLE